MLTDIFAYRYFDHLIWQEYTEVEQRLLNQAFGIVKDALPPYCDPKEKEIKANAERWKSLHDLLARELGIDELSKLPYSRGRLNVLDREWPVLFLRRWDYVCEHFVKAEFQANHKDSDRFIKERISFIELAMRHRGEQIAHLNSSLPQQLAQAALTDRLLSDENIVSDSIVDRTRASAQTQNTMYDDQITELNERFRRARAPLRYHNGFIQVSTDEVIERNIAKPFWDIVADPKWKNVDIDMKEALDRRDSNDKDPALFAAKALESAIKIVSDEKGWTRGRESGVSHYIDNLVSKANGRFLVQWEAEILREYFSKVRNSLGHGPGSEPMPELSIPQTDWAIETAMSWVRTIVRRM